MEINGTNITPELMEKAKACTSPEELLELAHEEGRDLTDNDLDGIAGGWADDCSDRSTAKIGDTRDDIDPARAHAEFVNGIVYGGELG